MDDALKLLESATRREIALPGVEIALLDWGGDGPPALLHHANGFCKELWALVAAELHPRLRVVAMDARGHGDSSRPVGEGALHWERFAEDIVGVAEVLVGEIGSPLAVGLGHSFGGTSMLGAAVRRPELFERVVAVDPVLPPPPSSGIDRREHVEGMVERARKRRADWPSRDEARAWFEERDLFDHWDPRALSLYVESALRRGPAGDVVLKCDPEVEAAIFAGGELLDTHAVARAAAVPVLLLWASRGNFPRATYERLVADMADGRCETIAGGHLVPMEDAALVAAAVLRFVDDGV